jgi:hypothetical protein
VLVIHNAIEANDFACHLETRDLVAPVFRRQASFEEASANGVKRRKFVAIAKKGAAAFDFTACGDQIVQAL